MKAGKVWGETRLLVAGPGFAVHKLDVRAAARCSMHRHRYRYNAFHVLSGRLWVDVEQEAYELTDTTELGPGETLIVPPGHWHRFRTGADGGASLLEVYYAPEVVESDIERRDVGGVVE